MNIGKLDRILRLVLGVVLILAALTAGGMGIWEWLLLLAGAAMLLTALTRRCPAYSLFGINTCGLK